jgi:predicted dehydrogenase
MVCDRDAARLDHMRERYPHVRATADCRELLSSGVDAVVVATPVSTHYPIARDCLQAGKHVLIEKPLAASSEQGRELLELGERVDRIVMVGHTFEYNPAVVAVKEIIDRGEIGDVYYVNCTRVNLGLFQPDINVVWDLAPHDISILRYVLGMDPQEVSARGAGYIRRDVHDVAYVTLHFPDGVLADVRVSWLDPCKIRRVTIVGSRKMIVYNDIEDDKVLIYDKGVEKQPYSDTLEEFHLAYRYGDVTVYPLEWVEPLRAECLHFLDCIRTGDSPRSDARAGLRVVQVLEAAQKSLLNGGLREPVVW